MKASLIISMILSLFLVAQVNAEEAAKSEESAAPQKVDMKNIEKKYWQPSDQSYTVVQSRTYAKEKKFGLSLQSGPVLMDQWSTGFVFDAALSYYFTERWGVELQGTVYSIDDNDLIGIIIDKGGLPDHGKASNFVGAFARWVPIYSKMSFMGNKVIYFDMSFGLGVGMMGYDQQLSDGGTGRVTQSKSTPSIAFDISQAYFISPKLALRVDYKMRFYNEEIVNYNTKGGAPSEAKGAKIRDDLSNATSLNMGITYFF
jgi:outer membrane beta-barrel protein